MISKTVVYIDSIREILNAVGALTRLLVRAGCSKMSATDAIQAYHSELAESDKRRISTEFTKPDSESVLESSVHRIVVATDAMGMGIDNPDILIVVQWGTPPSMGALLQRAGRAARGKGVYGKFIWLVQPWCFGDKTNNLLPRLTNQRMTDLQRRSILPRGIWELINRSDCIRRGILKYFDEDCATYGGPEMTIPCCSKCMDNKIQIHISKRVYNIRTLQSQKHITDAVKSALVEWRAEKAGAVLHPTLFKEALAELIIPDKAITAISRNAATIKSIGTLIHAANGEWGDLASYGKEALELIQVACLQAALKKQNLRITDRKTSSSSL
jgi:hypothetical protein